MIKHNTSLTGSNLPCAHVAVDATGGREADLHLTAYHAHGASLGLTVGAVARNFADGSIHPPPAPFLDGKRISFLRTLAIGNGSARQAPIFSVRR
jgi:hypothetical protein